MREFVSKHRISILFFAAALLSRLIFLGLFYPVFGSPALRSGDAEGYLNTARNIQLTKTFSSYTPPSSIPTYADAPLYPLFLFISQAKTSLLIPLALQAIIGAFIALLIYLLTKLLSNSASATIATGLYIFEPGTLFYTSQIYTEVLFTFFLVASIFYIILWEKTLSLRSFFFSSVTFALAVLTRPIGLYILPLFFLYILIVTKTHYKKAWIPIVKNILLSTIIISAIVSPWIIRNVKTFQDFAITTHESRILITYVIPSYWQWKQNTTFTQAQRESIQRFSVPSEENSNGFDSAASEELRHILLSDPLGYMFSQMSYFPQFFLSSSWQTIYSIFTGTTIKEAGFGETPKILPFRIMGGLFCALVTIFAFFGTLILIRQRKYRLDGLLMILLIGEFALITGALAHTRYRFPVNPFLFTLAGIALYSFWTKIRFARQ